MDNNNDDSHTKKNDSGKKTIILFTNNEENETKTDRQTRREGKAKYTNAIYRFIDCPVTCPKFMTGHARDMNPCQTWYLRMHS